MFASWALFCATAGGFQRPCGADPPTRSSRDVLAAPMTEVNLINYYLRNGYYRHAQTVCNETLKKRSNDPIMLFWRAVGMLKEGQAAEAVRELEGLVRRMDGQMQLPLKIALLQAHNSCKRIDNEAVTRLETDLLTEEDNAPDRARLTAAQLCWHLNQIDDAKRNVQAILRLQPTSVPALTLSGWLELALAQNELDGIKFADPLCNGDPSEEFEAAHGFFEKAQVATCGKKDLEASMGQAKLAHMKEAHKEALDHLSQATRHHTPIAHSPTRTQPCPHTAPRGGARSHHAGNAAQPSRPKHPQPRPPTATPTCLNHRNTVRAVPPATLCARACARRLARLADLLTSSTTRPVGDRHARVVPPRPRREVARAARDGRLGAGSRDCAACPLASRLGRRARRRAGGHDRRAARGGALRPLAGAHSPHTLTSSHPHRSPSPCPSPLTAHRSPLTAHRSPLTFTLTPPLRPLAGE
jgi:tetratricopeptide (TPR) repeat protein